VWVLAKAGSLAGNFTVDAGSGYAWPVFRGDGFVYAVGSNLLVVPETPTAATITWQLGDRLADAGAQKPGSFAGLVATPNGVLVAIPSEYDRVMFFVPDGGPSAAPELILRSPYFNKL
jgi:hypothetical protein